MAKKVKAKKVKQPKELNIKLKDVIQRRDDYISNALASHSKAFTKLQRQLFNSLDKNYLNRFEYKDNLLVYSKGNLRLVGALDNYFDAWQADYSNKAFAEIGRSMMELSDYSKEYFSNAEQAKKVTGIVEENISKMQTKLGIGENGKLIKDSYLSRLAETPQTREQLKNIVVKELSQATSYTDFRTAVDNFINGTENTVGEMMRFWDVEMHDAYMTLTRATDNAVASTLGMNWFVFLPDAIATTREWCEEKIGEIFHRAEVERWKDEDWQGKCDPYDPISDMGGYNCRHQPAWISDEEAEQMNPDKFEEWNGVLVEEEA